MSDYSSVSRGPLKLKGVSLKKKKKKLVGEKALKNELVNEKEKVLLFLPYYEHKNLTIFQFLYIFTEIRVFLKVSEMSILLL